MDEHERLQVDKKKKQLKLPCIGHDQPQIQKSKLTRINKLREEFYKDLKDEKHNKVSLQKQFEVLLKQILESDDGGGYSPGSGL
jgi:hypothetical protein